jgi:lysine-specific permease
MIICLAALVAINCFAVKGFGEIEYWLSLMKILAIVFFLGTSIYVIAKDQVGFSNYEVAGGPFLGKPAGDAIKNTLSAMVAATFSFGGTELVGITAGEAKNPRKSIPKAINGTFWRILFFYVSCIFVIGLLLPANSEEFEETDGDEPALGNSPFVLCLMKANLKGVVCFYSGLYHRLIS